MENYYFVVGHLAFWFALVGWLLLYAKREAAKPEPVCDCKYPRPATMERTTRSLIGEFKGHSVFRGCTICFRRLKPKVVNNAC